MLTKVRQLLSYEFTVAELIGLGLMLAAPYLLTGLPSGGHRFWMER